MAHDGGGPTKAPGKKAAPKAKRKSYALGTQGPARRGTDQRQAPAPAEKRSTRKQYLTGTQGPARRGTDQRQGAARTKHSQTYIDHEARILGGRSTPRTQNERRDYRDAFELRDQTGLHDLPTDDASIRKQAAAQRTFRTKQAESLLSPDSIGLQIKHIAVDSKPASLKKAAKDLQTAGIPEDSIAQGLNTLQKEHKSFALTALNQLTRPVSGIAAATQATYKGKNVASAFARGVHDNKSSFSDVLKDAHAPGWVQTVGGFGLDVALDPTTYITLGAGIPAKAAAKGAMVAAKRAGADVDEALAVARKVYDAHPQKARGLQIGLQGMPVRAASVAKHAARTGSLREGYQASVRRVSTKGTTSAKLVGQPAKSLSASVTKLPGARKLPAKLERAGIELVNTYRPRSIHPVDFDHARDAARRHRAARGVGERLAIARVKGYQGFVKKHDIKPEGLDRIAKALDSGKLDTLKDAERGLADVLKRDLSSTARREIDAGVRSADGLVENYWPRVMREIDPDGFRPATPSGSGGRRVTGSSFKARSEREALVDMPEAKAARYLTDDLEPVARRLGDSGRALALHTLHQDIAALGPVVKSLDEIDDLGGTLRTVYTRDGKGFKRLWNDVDGPDQIRAKVAAALKAGHEVRAIPEHTFEMAFEQAHRGKQSLNDGLVGRGFDSVQGKLKTLQTVVNPGYHMTNLIGDFFNARGGGATFGELKGAFRQVRLERKLDAFDGDIARSIEDLTAEALTHGGRVEHYDSNGKLTDAEIVDLARKHGAIQTGFAGSELHALNTAKETKRHRIDQRFLEGTRHFNEMREDVTRLVSFRSALKRGEDAEGAAAHVAAHHFDYADLTEAERRFARRIIPFYTFFRRNAPLQAKTLLKSPGRYATVEKARDNSARAGGLDPDFAYGLPAYVQQQVPFAAAGAKMGGMPLAVNLKLPLNDLNTIDPRDWPDQLAQRMSVLVKMPAEQWARYDTFFKDEIRKDFVPAPAWAASPQIKKVIEDTTGSKVKMIYDRASGKMVPGWSWRVDKIMRMLPVSGAVANMTTPGQTRHAKGLLATAGYLAGPRPFALDPAAAKTQKLFDELDNLTSEQNALKQTVKHRTGEKWGGEIKKIGTKMAKIQEEIAKLDATGGYDSPRFGKPAKKGKRKTYGVGGYGSGGYGSGYGSSTKGGYGG